MVIFLTVLVIFYVTNGARSTYESPFYTRTVAAIKNRQDAEARENVMAEEKSRMERVARIEKEHDHAVSVAAAEETSSPNDLNRAAGAGVDAEKQKPIVEDIKDAASDAAGKVKDAISGEGQKPVAGRKMMPDGRIVVNEKGSSDDGVAKVGNTGPQESSAVKGEKAGAESEEEHKVEMEMNIILKKGPIIIFSKSYCPYSKKAKHILLDLYSITPPPYVVELDEHKLGEGLQAALGKSTGRRTVPNVLINGKSIGGGDDVGELHESGKLIDTVQSMGGKRIMKIEKTDPKVEQKFKA